MIHVLHVTEDHSANNTGISSAVDAMTRCVPPEIQPAIVCVGEETIPLKAGVRLVALPLIGSVKFWRYASDSNRALQQAVAEADVVHLHGLWMWIQWAAARQAFKLDKPFVVTPHGMLETWIWQRQPMYQQVKKYLYWHGMAYPAFRRAARVHALTAREAGTLSNYFSTQTPVVIPHGIDLKSADQSLASLPPAQPGKAPYFLFVGRLHPVKGIHLLIRAFGRLNGSDFVLKIAGPIQAREQAYADSLKQLVSELGLERRVIFTGAVQGHEKWRLYQDAWAFCLPSYSEVIGLVNLEAAAARTPVITTFETGIVEDWDRCGGVRIHPEEEAILAALQQAQTWSPAERLTRGMALRTLVETHYSWTQVGQQWSDLYHHLAELGDYSA